MDEMRPPRFLREVVLTDEQEDRVFTLLHSAAPALREQSKAARAARRSLHELVTSAQFSDTAAGALAQAEGRAEGQTVLLRARLERDLYRVLTPEQVARLTTREQEWQLHRGEGPPRP
jgi:Spy/CpxP family protein refolding chaperone